jgi:hypothetical protein
MCNIESITGNHNCDHFFFFFFFLTVNRTSSWTIYITFLTRQLGAFKEFLFRFHINLLIYFRSCY